MLNARRVSKWVAVTACLALVAASPLSHAQVLWQSGGHANQVLGVDVRADGWMGSVSMDGTVKVWNADRELVTTIQDDNGLSLKAVALSPTEPIVAVAAITGDYVHLWNISTGALAWELPHPARPESIAYSSDGATLVTGGPTSPWLRAWNTQTGQLALPVITLPAPITSIAVAPDDGLVACGCTNGNIYLRYLQNGSDAGVLVGHTAAVQSLDFSLESTRLVSGSSDFTVRVWDVPRRAQLWSQGTGSAVHAVAYDHTIIGLTVASGGADNVVRVWNAATGAQIVALAGHTGPVRGVSYWPAGYLASCSEDFTIRRWQITSPYTCEVVTKWLTDPQVAYSPDGATVAGAALGDIRTFDSADGQQLLKWSAHSGQRIHALAYSPDGALLASTSAVTGEIKLWDPDTGTLDLRIPGSGSAALDVAFSPDVSKIAVSDANWTITIYDLATGLRLQTIIVPGYPDPDHRLVFAVAWSPDGTKLASGNSGLGEVLYLWNLTVLPPTYTQLVGHTGDIRDVAFSPDGTLLASCGSDASIRLWSVRTASQYGSTMIPAQGRQVNRIAFDSAGAVLASASCDAFIRFWDVATQQLIDFFGDETIAVQISLAMSPDDSAFAFGRADAAIVVADNPVYP